MKKALLTPLITLACYFCYAQTNTNIFPTTGFVGIGTTSPTAILEVTRGSLANSFMRLSNTGTYGSALTLGSVISNNRQESQIQYQNILGIWDMNGGSNSRLYIDPSGHVGLGTSSPSYLLSVGGNASSLNNEQASIQYLPTATSGAVGGTVSQIIANPAAASTASYYALYGESGDNSTVTSNLGLMASVTGSVIHRGTGTINQAMLLYASGFNSSFGGTIANAYGLYIGNLKVTGVTNSYGIYQASSNDINYFAGNVGIGTVDNVNWQLATSTYKLAVNGSAVATSMTVKLNANWPDYVFKKDYQLASLEEVKTYIDQNHHLPEMPSEEQVAKDGLNLGEMNKLLVKKVEELTLYLIEKDKQVKEDEIKLDSQVQYNQQQEARIIKLEKELELVLKMKTVTKNQ
jgi:hypothetical protein